jgi:hypothetical protein
MAVFVGSGFAAVILVVTEAMAGPIASFVAFLAAEVAVLTFVTVRAYPPQTKAPMVWMLVLTLVFSVAVPLSYITWLWITKKKWRQLAPGEPVVAADATAGAATLDPGVAEGPAPEADADFKPCPDCAEPVRSAAHVCRYCGYRFA